MKIGLSALFYLGAIIMFVLAAVGAREFIFGLDWIALGLASFAAGHLL